MNGEIAQHIAAVEAAYRPLITAGNSRLEGGAKLWGQFMDAVDSYRGGMTTFAAVYERINELEIARILLADASLMGCRILYEPQVAADGRRIDFVVVSVVAGGNLYIEVKTVRPTAGDTKQNWLKYENRRKRHAPNVKYVVAQEWMGARFTVIQPMHTAAFSLTARPHSLHAISAMVILQSNGTPHRAIYNGTRFVIRPNRKVTPPIFRGASDRTRV
jgi:hypothetical protein